MKLLFEMLANLLFPPKCVLCGKLLSVRQTDLCRDCREKTEVFSHSEEHPYRHKWISVWYSEGKVRESLLRFKFGGARSYAEAYGRLLSMTIVRDGLAEEPFVLSWIPVSRKRAWKRGYDQVRLIAERVSRELGVELVPTLKKVRDNPAQSGMGDAAARRANVSGVYRAVNADCFSGKRVLLLDDIMTTGATAGECARVLLTAGAEKVDCAVVAAVRQKNETQS